VRLALLVTAVVVAAVLAGCGGSGDQTLSVGEGQTITVDGDIHGFYGELEAILEALPYQRWYVDCVVREAKKIPSPEEAEELEDLPEAEREEKAAHVVAKAAPACEKSGRPTIDPNASSQELEVLRASSVPGLTELAEANHLKPVQVACVQSLFKKLPDKQLIELRNGTARVREGILVSVFKPCARLK
jgi:hypothetical protein